MSYKDLLVVLDAEPAAAGRAAFAARLAERFAAHLIGLYPVPDFARPREFGYYDPALLDPIYRELREQAEAQAEAMRQTFEEAVRRRGLSAEWRAVTALPDGDPAVHARYVDLAILGQRDPDRAESASLPPRPEHVALASGRPFWWRLMPAGLKRWAGGSWSPGARRAKRRAPSTTRCRSSPRPRRSPC